MHRTPTTVRLKQGKTRRSDLAVRAYRVLYMQADDRRESRTTRRFILNSRLEALLKILTPAETAFYYHEIGLMAGAGRR